MSVAKKFLEELQAGNVNEAIDTINAGLKESTASKITEQRQDILASYGFVAEKKEPEQKDDDEEDNKDDDTEEEEGNE